LEATRCGYKITMARGGKALPKIGGRGRKIDEMVKVEIGIQR